MAPGLLFITQLADVDLGPLRIGLYQRLGACFRPSLLKVRVVRDEGRDLLRKVERRKSLVFRQQPRYFRQGLATSPIDPALLVEVPSTEDGSHNHRRGACSQPPPVQRALRRHCMRNGRQRGRQFPAGCVPGLRVLLERALDNLADSGRNARGVERRRLIAHDGGERP